MAPQSLPLVAERRGILDLTPSALEGWLAEHGEPRMRVTQIRHAILVRRAEAFNEMTDLPRPLRQALAEHFVPLSSRVTAHQQARDGTHKLLLTWPDQRSVECVLLQEGRRRTACLSTQVGCGMGCVFCASGLNGLERQLTAGEIVEQLVRLRNLLPPDERLTHVVVMGMGEPLANLDHLLEALEVANDPRGLGIGARHITISTVGLPSRIRQLAETGKEYHLAVSLHAPNDTLRDQIVPTNDKIGLAAILSAADDYFRLTGRQVTYEYVLLGGINDQPSHARELGRLLKGRKAHVNLIPFNEVEGLPYRRPRDDSLVAFMAELRQVGISVKVRKRKGSEIDAACGQLRRRTTMPQFTT